jgi:hypothetical protein
MYPSAVLLSLSNYGNTYDTIGTTSTCRPVIYVVAHIYLLVMTGYCRRTIFTGSKPTNNLSGMLKINVRWSPMPYPNGITQLLLTSKSPNIHNPSIGNFPWKNVAPELVPVCWRIASHRSSPSLFASAFPRGPLIMCSLWSRKRTTWLPFARHFVSWVAKCVWKRTIGQVRSFFLVMKYFHCCWYVVPKFSFFPCMYCML